LRKRDPAREKETILYDILAHLLKGKMTFENEVWLVCMMVSSHFAEETYMPRDKILPAFVLREVLWWG
jgi:hypothetical protein